ncbi:MAG: nicotinate-nucleotide--dimethylbenzimidazole phosphoribosyltransferase [Cyanobacteria bacterium K_DeepCast_35m_m2_023]|nr:nicotinate-nucleotide--dimethylbenzimidazole phosphoribosyltransferase [Cyanobacteria bacterium K_DeepCast_35m_m2_023]
MSAELQRRWTVARPLLLLASTDTAAVEGISAAGATAASRRLTAAADAELLVLGPGGQRPHGLPPLPAGLSPALISHVVLRQLGLLPRLMVVDLGCAIAPAVPHLRLPDPESAGPASCLSSGGALPLARVQALLARGRCWGQRWPPEQPLLLAECVPGGTSTALAVLLGLDVAADGLVGGSLLLPVHALKADLARRGLAAAGLGGRPATTGNEAGRAQAVLAAVGDPMQALAAGLCLAMAKRRLPVVLAGGSQMAAVLALALALAPTGLRPALAEQCVVATTAWLAHEAGSDLALLLRRIDQRWCVRTQLAVAALRFDGCRSPALQDFERGYVKEGVGAGALAWLWELSGRSPQALAAHCDAAAAQLLGTTPTG